MGRRLRRASSISLRRLFTFATCPAVSSTVTTLPAGQERYCSFLPDARHAPRRSRSLGPFQERLAATSTSSVAVRPTSVASLLTPAAMNPAC